MKLWLVIYVGADITWFAGPMPLAACSALAREMIEGRTAVIETGKTIEGEAIGPSDMETVKAMRIECELRDVEPGLALDQ